MSDLVSQKINMIFKSPKGKGETVHALKDISFTLKKYSKVVDTSYLPTN